MTNKATEIQVEGGIDIKGPVKLLFIIPVEMQEEDMYGQIY